MEYKITEIIKEIRESLPEERRLEIIRANRSALKPHDVVCLLEEKGLLEYDGNARHPSAYGRSRGISEELRTAADGKEFYQILYSEDARDLVRSIIFSEYPALDPDREFAFIHRVTAHFPGTGINASRRIAENNPGRLIIMYCAPIYRAYDESADAICRTFDLPPYVNEDGVHGIIIKPEDLDHVVIPRLLNGDRSFIVNGENEAHIYTAVRQPNHQAEPVRPERGRTARYGMCVEIADQRGEVETIYLAAREHSDEIEVHLADGNIVATRVPIREKDGVQILSPESPLSMAIVGCRENTSFTFNGLTYKICRVFRSESVNETTIR